VDEEMEIHAELLKEIEDSPMDINAIVTKRRKDFTGEFFRYLSVVQETHDRLEDRDGLYRGLGKKMIGV
ncbi:endoribonuclease E-like protein, partial [Tanacetum coccineum]